MVWPEGRAEPMEKRPLSRTIPGTSVLSRGSRRAPLAFAAAALVIVWSAIPVPAQEYVPTADLEHPKVRYPDSKVSLNDRCPVRGGKLSTTYKPVYVNGQPIGFC